MKECLMPWMTELSKTGLLNAAVDTLCDDVDYGQLFYWLIHGKIPG